jgi:hypothetical protein
MYVRATTEFWKVNVGTPHYIILATVETADNRYNVILWLRNFIYEYLNVQLFLNRYRSNVEFNSTALAIVPGPVSSSNRQDSLLCLILVFPELLVYGG